MPQTRKPIDRGLFQETLSETIKNRLDDPFLGVQDLCTAVHLSRAQLHRRLKAQTGLSATLFIRSVRLERAKEMLMGTDLPISQVAFDVGFHDQAFFSRVFSREFGLTPVLYRRKGKPS